MRPPYGYALEPNPHHNPQKAKEGRKKHRLILDPVKAPIMAMIFADYTENEVFDAVEEQLQAELRRSERACGGKPCAWRSTTIPSIR